MADIVNFPNVKTTAVTDEYEFSNVLKSLEAKMAAGEIVKDKYVILAFNENEQPIGYINNIMNTQLVYLFERLKMMYL